MAILPKRVQISLDMKQLIIVLLLVLIGVMLVAWKPWQGTTSGDRTVKVTGEAKLKAEPDQYIFYPNYQFKNANKDAALADLSKKSDEIVAELKQLGVAPSKIKTNSNGNQLGYFRDQDNTPLYTLTLTITTSKDLAQKVQDYLVTTQPLGGVSPQTGFSDTLRKHLEAQARDEATKDARAKADQSARNLGFTVAKVKTVEDGAGFGGVIPMNGRATMALDSSAAASQPVKLDIQPGEDEITYSVTVTYFVR